MVWKEKVKEFGGGDMCFLSEDGEVLKFVVVGEPLLLEGKFKGKPSEKIAAPVVTEDGFQIFVIGKRLFRKIAKHEERFKDTAFMAVRRGEGGDINASYELKIVDDKDYTKLLLDKAKKEFKPDMIADAVIAVQEVMNN